MNTVVCILGPTASGKTDLAIRLAQEHPMDIVSVDSAMVYKGMDIGTAKPTLAQQRLTPHRLIDLCDPKESYSAGKFCEDALREIKSSLKQGRIPLLVGGTMFYFHLLQRGFIEFPDADLSVRQDLEQEAHHKGWAALHQELRVVDPDAAMRIDPNDKQRISRALELYRSVGKTMSQLQQEQRWQPWSFEFVNVILLPRDRKILQERIEQRLDLMLQRGFVDEVSELFHREDLNAMLPSIRTVGYRQVWSYLSGEYDLNEMRQRVIFATRQFAKRQFTWLRRWNQTECFDSEASDLYVKVQKYLFS